jgi:hypothetical protein
MFRAMIKKVTIATALLVCLLAFWIYSERKSASAVRPPEGATNLAAFLAARPQPIQIRRFTHDGKMRVEVVGKPVASLLSLPSGPPAYIFNESGILVDWTSDLGDNPSFIAKWGGLSNAISISVEEAKQLVKAHE